MGTPKKIGRYEILGELGHGAMGTVYRAKDPAMDRVVAVKTIISLALASDQVGDFRERFYREARAAGALTHPGIVPVFDVGEHEGVPFLVMEFISGKTLDDTIKRGQRMTLDRVCEIGQKVAEALGYAHQHGVVHRDIKPANILLTSRESHGIERPKITDFGVAKMTAGHTTLTGNIVGTPAFMPPEQITGSPIDGRADLFSLGVVLYWMATGEQPFPGESITAVSYKVVHTEPVPPRKLNPAIPIKLESIILKCLAKNPDERYQTGEELARELGELRSVSTSMGLKNASIGAASEGHDPNETLVETLTTAKAVQNAAAQPPQVAAPPAVNATSPPQGKRSNLPFLAAVAIVVIAAGGWFLSHRSEKPLPPAPDAPAQVKSDPQLAPAPLSANTDEAPAKPATESSGPAPVATVPKSPAAPPPKKAEIKPPAVEKVLPPKAEIVPPEPASVDFDPKSLDPKTNAKLKIEAGQMPANLDFIVEMNGKIYLRGNSGGNKTEIDDLYVPPGVQEFRVTAGSGSARKSSNTVSTEFKAKKRHTLKIELRTQDSPAGKGVPQGLYPDTQIVLTLK